MILLLASYGVVARGFVARGFVALDPVCDLTRTILIKLIYIVRKLLGVCEDVLTLIGVIRQKGAPSNAIEDHLLSWLMRVGLKGQGAFNFAAVV